MLPADRCGRGEAGQSQPATGDIGDVTDSTDPLPLLSEPYGTRVTEAQWNMVLDLTRKGLYRQATIAQAIGRSVSVIRMRCARDPEWAELYAQAVAEGEMHVVDCLVAEGGGGWTRYAWILERIHRLLSAQERANIDHKRAMTDQVRASLAGPTERPDPDARFE